MQLMDFVAANLLNPAIMSFILGIIAAVSKSNLNIEQKVFDTISIYLLFAIGIKGGIKISHNNIIDMSLPLIATIVLAVITTMTAYFILNKLGKIDKINSAAIAAHHGSVSVVTFMAASSYLQTTGVQFEGYMIALTAILEVPSIVIATIITSNRSGKFSLLYFPKLLIKSICSKSVLLLVGGLIIGAISTQDHQNDIKYFFEYPFKGVLCLFLLQMGINTTKNWQELKNVGRFLIIFNLLIPLPFAAIGIILGKLAGLSFGGSVLMGVMAASSSYIAVPAAIKTSIPEANGSVPLVTTLGINVPFNIVIGITIYYYLAMKIWNI